MYENLLLITLNKHCYLITHNKCIFEFPFKSFSNNINIQIKSYTGFSGREAVIKVLHNFLQTPEIPEFYFYESFIYIHIKSFED